MFVLHGSQFLHARWQIQECANPLVQSLPDCARLSDMHFARTSILAALLAAAPATFWAQQSAPPPNVQRLRWYDAYDLGMKAVQSKQWQNAEAYLQQAKSAGPAQGRRVYYFGDTYRPFYPDYYLAIVYLNTRRQALAETAFADVQRRNLIDPKDKQFTDIQQLARQATFERSMNEATELIAKGDLTEAGKRAAEAKSTNFDNGKADAIQQEITKLAMNKPAPPLPGPIVPPVQQTPIEPTPPAQNTAIDPVERQPPPYTQTGAPKPIVPTPTPSPPKNAVSGGVIAGPGGLLASAYLQFSRSGLLAYFSGDYTEAIQQLETIPEGVASPRDRVFLACARAAVVLTGRGDAAVLRTARAEYQKAGRANALRPQDRRFISPKVLELLEKS